jgi:hypothetical protein
MSERYREEESRYRGKGLAAAAARAKKQRDELAAKKAASDAAIQAANLRYQQTQTPLGEKVREIEKERQPEAPVTVLITDPETGEDVKVYSGKGGRGRGYSTEPTTGITKTYTTARAELKEEGYREEDIETPFVDLGGTPETGYKPPYVLEEMQADIDARAEEPVMVDGVAMMPAQARKLLQGRGTRMIGGMLLFASLLSFAMRVRDG